MDKQEREHLVRELVEKVVEESGLNEKTAELKAQVQALEAKQGLLDLEHAEERVEVLAKRHGLNYEAAFKLVVEELEEKEQERKARLDEISREQTTTRLAQMDEEEELRLLEQEEEG